MTIIKKSGGSEPFSPEKLSRSIAAASDDARQPLNESDIHNIISEFQEIVQGKELITTRQIDIIVNGILYSKGYFGALKEYATFKKSHNL